MPNKIVVQAEQKRSWRNVTYVMAILSLLATLVIGIVSLPQMPVGVTKIADLPSDFLREIGKGVIAFLVSLIVTVLLSCLAFFLEFDAKLNSFSEKVVNFETSLTKGVDDFAANISRAFDCRYLGTAEAALPAILGKARKARVVRNTLVMFEILERDVAVVCYSETKIAEIHECIKQVLADGEGAWTDIVSQDVINSSSLKWFELVNTLKGTSGISSRYRLRRLKETYPIINFMILGSQNDSEEVIFGWGHHSEDPGGKVFITQNAHLVSVFDHFWDMLEDDSVALLPDTAWPIAPADIIGIWFSQAYACPTTGVVAPGRVPAGNPVNSALLEIKVNSDRNLIVRGAIFRGEKTWPIESVAADLTDDRLSFLSKNSEESFNAGYYQFIHLKSSAKKPNAGKSNTTDEFYGQFLIPPGGNNKDQTKLLLVGHRITDELLGTQGLPAEPTKLPDDPRLLNAIVTQCRIWWETTGNGRWPKSWVFDPGEGPVAQVVTISGTGFGAARGTVKFGATRATEITSWTDTTIQVKVPDGARSGDVVVAVGGTDYDLGRFTVNSGPAAASALNPTHGEVGSTVTISGKGFGTTRGTVKFAGTSAMEVESWDDTKIKVKVPAGAQTGEVVATFGGSDHELGNFTVDPAAVASPFNPSHGAVGTVVTISGTGFGTTKGTMKFGATAATEISSWADKEIKVKVPAGAQTGEVVATFGGTDHDLGSFTVP
jgi:hypothetical protein